MCPGGSADIHLVKIKGNVTPGNKEFSLLRNMRFFQVMTRNIALTQNTVFFGDEFTDFSKNQLHSFSGERNEICLPLQLAVLKHRLIKADYKRSGSTMRQIQVAVFINRVENEKNKELRSVSSEMTLNVRLLLSKNYTS
jgi:hypothetical protein